MLSRAPVPVSLFPVKIKLDENGNRIISPSGEPSLITSDESQDFLFSHLTDADLETLDTWVRRRHIRMVRDSFDNDMTEEERETELKIAYLQASTLSWLSPLGARLMASIEGMSYLAWLAIRKKHQDITREELLLMMSDARNIGEIARALEESGNRAPFQQARPTGLNPKRTTASSPPLKTPKKRSKRKAQPRKKRSKKG